MTDTAEPPKTRQFPYNPDHAIGTCSRCGGEMVYNVPRMAAAGGFVHKASGRCECAGYGHFKPMSPDSDSQRIRTDGAKSNLYEWAG